MHTKCNVQCIIIFSMYITSMCLILRQHAMLYTSTSVAVCGLAKLPALRLDWVRPRYACSTLEAHNLFSANWSWTTLCEHMARWGSSDQLPLIVQFSTFCLSFTQYIYSNHTEPSWTMLAQLGKAVWMWHNTQIWSSEQYTVDQNIGLWTLAAYHKPTHTTNSSSDLWSSDGSIWCSISLLNKVFEGLPPWGGVIRLRGICL